MKTNSEVVSTDVLVLGGGIAGCLAAIKARESGLEVTLVDKGHLGRSGYSHQMSGILTCFEPDKDDAEKWYRECVEASEWLADQKRLEGMVEETHDRIMDLERWGVKFHKENGRLIRKAGIGCHYIRHVVMVRSGFQLMSVLRGEVLRQGVKVLERVMVTDLLTLDGLTQTNGSIIGAVGFNIRTGTFYISRAKGVVDASGAASNVHSRLPMPNLSGDGKAMAFRAGCEMRNIEVSMPSDRSVDFNCASGTNILLGEGAIVVNALGERFMKKWDPVRIERAPRAVFCRAISVEELEGRGPVYYDATHLDESSYRRIEDAIPIVLQTWRAGGVDIRKDKVAYTTSLSDHGAGGIRVDRQGATTIPGLYAAGAASDHGECGVCNVISNGMASAIGGCRAGASVAQYAVNVGDVSIDEDQVKGFRENLFSPMKRKAGVSYQEAFDAFMRVWEEGLIYPIRNKDGLTKAIQITQEVRDQYLPRLAANDYHELARIIGLSNGLLFPELLAKSALVRTESRGGHYREDFPERDDEHWLKWVILKKERDEVNIRIEPIPFHEYPIQPSRR